MILQTLTPEAAAAVAGAAALMVGVVIILVLWSILVAGEAVHD